MHRPDLHTADLEQLATWPAAEAVARLAAISRALPTCGDPGALEDLARALPVTVAALAPEVCLALQALALALVPHGPRIPRDVAGLEPRLRVAWRQVQLAAGEAALELDEHELLQVVHAWSIDGVLDPSRLLRRLVTADDVRLRAAGLGWIEPAVRQLAVTPVEAFALLVPLAADVDARLRARAVSTLCKGWVRGLSPTASRERERLVVAALVDPEVAVVQAAVGAAEALGRRDWLLERVLADEGAAQCRVDALIALGPLARDEDIDVALALASSSPLSFGPALRRFLLAAHRHGVFVRERHLEALLAAFAAHPLWTAEELVRVTYVVRVELVELLAALGPDDPRWIRRAAILAASFGTRAPMVLRERLGQVRDVAVAEALIEAAGRSPEYVGETHLLAWLDRLPERVIPALRVKGGPEAELMLGARALDPRCDATLRALALDVLWALSGDRGALLRQLAAQLGPHASGLLDGSRLVHRDRVVARIVADAPWEDDPAHAIEATRRLEILCESGDLEHMPRIIALFREVFRGLVRRALAGDFTIKRVAIPELEQQLFRYGRHLIREGRSVRRWIEAGPETGRDLVLQVAIDWLREGPAAAVCVALLELVGRHTPGPATLRFIEPFWRHGDREVRRAAIEAILAAGEGARGLELSICRLAAQEEPRILCQALAAVATLNAAWAEPIVLAALQRPEMAVKKDAAHALAHVGSERSLAALVEWLAHHDNRGFRDELLAALQHVAGPSMVAVLVSALEDETEARRIELLWDALGGRLPVAAALRLARSERPAHRALLAACLKGQVALADGDAGALAAQLHRARLLARPAVKDPGQRLRTEGFSTEAARGLVEQRAPELESAILATVRVGLAEWIAWLRAEGDARALALVLDAAQAQHGEQVGALIECATRCLATVDMAAVAGFLERCVAGRSPGRHHEVAAIGLLRAAPDSAGLGGLRRYRLLGRLGAVRSPADLERCLAASRIGPDHANDSATLLCEALAIPAATDDEPPELTALREQARRWHAQDASARAAWLAATLLRRPLDLPVVEPPSAPPRPRFQPRSQDDLEALGATLCASSEQERSRAAARLLDWPDAWPVWPQVLEALLRGQVALGAEHRGRVAPLLTRWPDEPGARRVAAGLLPHCSARQHRDFVRAWVEGWSAGDAGLAEQLQSTGEALLLPLVWAAAERGDYRLARLLRPGRSSALRSLVAWISTRSPADVEHLVADAPEVAVDDTADPGDPIMGQGPDELLALLAGKEVVKGLAVRAVHALVAHGERAVAPLASLVVDPRPPVRSAALRALRQVASREQSLDAAAQALAMETRPDVVLQLMKSLGHGRHEPSLPALLERLEHREPRIREGAHEAIRAWGPEVVPALRRAARRARPDRRPAYMALITELEPRDE
jgi:HEAT repeat protein